MVSGKVLILDDEERMARLIARSLERSGYQAVACADSEEALTLLKEESFDVLVTDLRMPGYDGIEILTRAKSIDPGIDVILMTAYASVDTVREAMKRGAVDYLEKPISSETDLKPILERLISPDIEREERPKASHPVSLGEHEQTEGDLVTIGVTCRSELMQGLYKRALKVARSNASVLLRGESGTGKEIMAEFIRRNSRRAEKPFVKVNCGALTETLLESELFGHVRGSFTGAVADREGLFSAADGGTILLDEIGEVSPALQVKLLRILQQGQFTPVGSTSEKTVDVRVIAATNRDLEGMIKKGEFREDLYYRLNVVPLEIPPLRKRKDDLPDLIDYFVAQYSPTGEATFSPIARESLLSYHWPGNIRELENAIEHAMVLGDPASIDVEDLPITVQDNRSRFDATEDAVGSVSEGASLEEIEKRCLMQALDKTNGNRTRAAKLLNITRRTLGYRLKKYELEEEINNRFAN